MLAQNRESSALIPEVEPVSVLTPDDQLLPAERINHKKLNDSDFICPKSAHLFYNWLKNIDQKSDQISTTIVITGKRGIGKNFMVKKILHSFDYQLKYINSTSIKNKNLFNEIFNFNSRCLTQKPFAILINEMENITLSSEKKIINNIHRLNIKKRLFPLIVITHNHHSKFFNILHKDVEILEYMQPDNKRLESLIEEWGKNNIPDDVPVLKKTSDVLIFHSQGDIRNLFLLLDQIKLIFADTVITRDKILDLLKVIQPKKCTGNLFLATRMLMTSFQSISSCLSLYETDKVLLPLTLYENYYKMVCLDPLLTTLEKIKIMAQVSSYISYGDVIETSIYSEQNWFLQDVHGFVSCVNNSYLLSKVLKTYSSIQYGYSNDLNNTSLKNINKKNIINLIGYLKEKKIIDLLYLNKIISHPSKKIFLKQENPLSYRYKCISILKNKYHMINRNIEILSRLDKTSLNL
ncbi:putative replication factor C large subunit [Namao virus]|nr:putative replication factor C large subunit [Namao virus]